MTTRQYACHYLPLAIHNKNMQYAASSHVHRDWWSPHVMYHGHEYMDIA